MEDWKAFWGCRSGVVHLIDATTQGFWDGLADVIKRMMRELLNSAEAAIQITEREFRSVAIQTEPEEQEAPPLRNSPVDRVAPRAELPAIHRGCWNSGKATAISTARS